MSTLFKTCSKCKQEKSVADFPRNRNAKDGFFVKCRDCNAAASRAYHKANRAAIKERQRAYREANKESIKARKRAHYEATRDAYREAKNKRKRAYYAANRETILEKQRAYNAAHPEVAAAKTARRRARKLAATTHAVSSVDLARIRSGQCAHTRYGGCEGPTHIDHIVPLSRGGNHSVGNLQPLCARHNLSKSNKLEVEVRAQSEAGKEQLEEVYAERFYQEMLLCDLHHIQP